ncbi:MAG TPA: hypothetical protein VKA53_04080 [Thermoanaerobaculia bacterium]|nr:hypothetical protein [Thermoanaerobaculia bacterium]
MRHSIYKQWMVMSPLARTGVGACLLLAILALALRVVGASWINVAFAVVPLGVAFLLVVAEPRLHWLTRPKPKLTLTVSGADGGQLVSGGLPPWPLQIERIVANEAAEALDTMQGREALPSFLAAGAAGLVSPPTKEDHQRARQEFGAEVETYQEQLREWLNEYAEMVLARWETFAISLVVTNAVGAAHAEAVEFVLELPESVNRSTPPVGRVEAPPSRPTYRPPQPRSLLPLGRGGWSGPYPRITWRGPGVDLNDIIPSERRRVEWEESATGRRLTAPRIDVQPGRSVEIVAPLWLRARGPGVHEVRWTAYSQSLDHPVRGAFRLEVPEEPPQRPPFGRLEGVLRFPDIEIAMGDDEAAEVDGDRADANGDRAESARSIRDSDPPLAPPSEEAVDGGQGEALASLRGAVRRWEWEALGLDPALDCPSSTRVTVGRAQPDINAD